RLLSSETTGSRFSFLRLQITTSAPAFANSTAMERPIPTPPPVTMATFFSRENGDAAMMPPARDHPLPSGERARVRGPKVEAWFTSRADYTQALGAALSKRLAAPVPG